MSSMITPSLAEIIQAGIDAREIWTVNIGQVQKANGDGTVDVLPLVRRPVENADGSMGAEDLPVIPNVRIAYLQSGAVAFTFPIAVGDTGLLLHTTYSTAEVRATGAVSTPGDLRTHHIANAVYLPAFVADSKTATYAADPDVVVEPGSAGIRLGGGATQLVPLDNLIQTELGKIKTAIAALATATAPSGGGPCTFTGSPAYSPGSTACTKVKAL